MVKKPILKLFTVLFVVLFLATPFLPAFTPKASAATQWQYVTSKAGAKLGDGAIGIINGDCSDPTNWTTCTGYPSDLYANSNSSAPYIFKLNRDPSQTVRVNTCSDAASGVQQNGSHILLANPEFLTQFFAQFDPACGQQQGSSNNVNLTVNITFKTVPKHPTLNPLHVNLYTWANGSIDPSPVGTGTTSSGDFGSGGGKIASYKISFTDEPPINTGDTAVLYAACVDELVDQVGQATNPFEKKPGQNLNIPTVKATLSSPSSVKQTGKCPAPTVDSSGAVCDAGAGVTWIVCALINFIAQTTQTVSQHFIIPYLVVQPVTTDSSSQTYASWKSLRTVADVLLVIAFFIIIFSQALSLNIDAYTIKKMLPKLVAATILIQFSFYIAAIAVDIANILGNGIGNLFTNLVLPNVQNVTSSTSAPHFSEGIIIATGIAVGFGLVATGTLLAVLVPLVLTVVLVAFVLILRQVLIIALIISAPVAFVLWILPNTSKYFKYWWDLFSKSLLMYPLITLLFAAGTITTRILIDNPAVNGNTAFQDILAIIAVTVPLALVPLTFRFAGSALGAIHTGINSLRGRVMGGADGKGGLGAALRNRTQETRNRASMGGTMTSRIPYIGAAVRYGARPYIGARGARNREIQAVAAINERAKTLGDGLGQNQLELLAYGTRRGVQREIAHRRSIGDNRSADELQRNYDNNWHSIEGLARNTIDQAAAAKVMADRGQGTEGMAVEISQRMGRLPVAEAIMQQLQGSMLKEGRVSARGWLSEPGTTSREEAMLSAVKSIDRESLQKMRDWGEFVAPRAPVGQQIQPRMFDQVLSGAAGTAQDRTGLITALQSAIADTANTSIARRQEIMDLMTRHGIPVVGIQPQISKNPPADAPTPPATPPNPRGTPPRSGP